MFSFWSIKLPKDLKEQEVFCKKIIQEGALDKLSKILKTEPLLLNRIFESDKKRTLLHWAVYERQLKIVEFLLNQRDINVHSQDFYEQTPLYSAIRYSTGEIINLLLEKGADPNHVDKHGFTPLIWAILSAGFKEPGRDQIDEERATDIIKILITHDAKVNQSDQNNDTPLHHAASEGHEFVIPILLEAGSFINAVNQDQETPLHLAAKNGHAKIVQILLRAGANKELRNKEQLTPFELAHQADQDLNVRAILLTAENRFSMVRGNLSGENSRLKKLKILTDLIVHKKDYSSAQRAYKTEILTIHTWEQAELPYLLDLVPSFVELACQKEEFLEIENDLKDAIQKIVHQVSLIEQAKFYKKIGDVFLQYKNQDPLPYYTSALNIMEELCAENIALPSNFDEQLCVIQQTLNKLEVEECYQYAEPLIKNYCQHLRDESQDLLASHHYLQQLRPLLSYLQQEFPNKLKEIYLCLRPVIRHCTIELLYQLEQNENFNIIETVETTAKTLLQHHQLEFAADIIQLVLMNKQLSAETIIFWKELELCTFEEAENKVANVLVPAQALYYRAQLKQHRQILKKGLEEHKSTLELQAEYAKNITSLVEAIARASAQWLGEPPCAYAWIGIGSLSTQALSPYSDLDCALLIANEEHRKHPYFKAFVLIVNRIIKGLGEPWDWSNNVIIGLHLDTGDLGRLLASEDPKIFPSLLNTPEGLVKWVVENSIKPESKENNLLAFSLLSPCLLYASSTPSGANLLLSYQKGLVAGWQLTKVKAPLYRQAAVQFWKDLLQPLLSAKAWPSLDIKRQYLSPLNYLASLASLYYGFVDSQNRVQTKFPDILLQLQHQKHWDNDYLSQLFLAWEYALHWRAAEQFKLYDAPAAKKVALDWEPLFRDVIQPWKILGNFVHILSEMPQGGHFHPMVHSFKYWLETVSEDNLNKMQRALAEDDAKIVLTGLVAYLSRKQLSAKNYVDYYEYVPEKYRFLFYQALQIYPPATPEILQAINSYPDQSGHSWAVDEEKQNWEQGLLRLVSPQSQSEINFSIEGATIGKQYLKPEIIETLVQKQFLIEEANSLDFNFQKKIDLIAGLKKEILNPDKKSDCNVAQGNHFVFPIQHEGVEIHAKVRPDFPGMEIAFSLLIRRIIGEGSPCVALWRFASGDKHYPVLLSQTVSGEILTNELLKQYPLERKSYSQLVLMSFLVNPGDGNPGNFLAQRVVNAKNKIVLRLVSIDNDRLFSPAFEGGHLKIASILYCFHDMIAPVHPEVRKRLLKLNVKSVLNAWLEDLEKLNVENLKIFEKDLALYMNDKVMNKQKSFIFSILKERTLETVAKKFRMIQYFLQKEPKISHLRLFNLLQPSLATYYSNALAGKTDLSKKPPETPIEIFEYVVGNEYRREMVAGVRRSSSSVRMEEYLKVLGIEITSAEKMVAQWEVNFARAQEELSYLSESLEVIDLTIKETLNGSFVRFSELSAYSQGQVIAKIHLDKDLVIAAEGPDLLKQRQWWLGLINCQHLRLKRLVINSSIALDDKIFSALWRRLSAHVERLEIVGCQNLNSAFTNIQSKKLKHIKLKQLNLVNLIYLNTPALQYLEVINNGNLKNLTIKASVLTKLNAAKNETLLNLDIDAPRLNEIDFSDCFELSDLQLKKVLKKCEKIAVLNLEGCKEDKISYKSIKELAPSIAAVDFPEELLAALAAIIEDILTNKLEELDVFERFTGDKLFAGLAFKAIYQALLRNQSVTKVNLSISFMGDEETILLAELLKKNSNVKQLLLFEKNISDEGIVALADALEDNCTIESLLLGPNIGDKGAKALGKMVEKNHSIELLALIGNSIGNLGAKELAEGLKCNRTLAHFGLIANNVGDLGAQCFAEALEKSALASFGLLANGVGNRGAAALGLALEKNRSIIVFGLASNNIEDEGSALLIEGLRKNNQIYAFGLLATIGVTAAKKFSEVLTENNYILNFLSEDEVPENFEKWYECPAPALVFDANSTPTYFLFRDDVNKINKRSIDEINCEVDKDYLKELMLQGLKFKNLSFEDPIAQFIEEYHAVKLQNLMLISKAIADKELSLLSDGLSKNKTMKELVLIGSTITKDNAGILATIVENSCLKKLNLLGCGIGDSEIIAFSETLKKAKRENKIKIDLTFNSIGVNGFNALKSVAEEIEFASFHLDGIKDFEVNSEYIQFNSDSGAFNTFGRFFIRNIAFLTHAVPFVTSFMSSTFIKFILWLAKERFNYSVTHEEHAFLPNRLAFFAKHHEEEAALLDYDFSQERSGKSQSLTLSVKEINPNALLEKDYMLAWQIQADEYRKALSQNKSALSGYYQLPLSSGADPLFAHLIQTEGDGDCFFHAVKSSGVLNFTRSDLVEKLFKNAGDFNVRHAFSLEIRQFLYLGYTSAHENEAENAVCEILLTPECIKQFQELNLAEEQLRQGVENARLVLRDINTKGLKPLELIALLKNAGLEYAKILKEFYEDVQKADEALSEHCSQQKVFEGYVISYLQAARGYIAFSRDFTGLGKAQTTIDIINKLFDCNIQVYLENPKNRLELILVTQPVPDKPPILIFHDGVNHFCGLEFKKQSQLAPLLFSKAAEKEQEISMLSSKRDGKKEDKSKKCKKCVF